MPTTAIDLPAKLDPPRKLWTRQEYEELSSFEISHEQHLELVEGELIDKIGKIQPHVISLTHLLYWLVRVFGERLVCPEAPIDVAPEDNPTNVPEPDIIVVNRDLAFFASQRPCP